MLMALIPPINETLISMVNPEKSVLYKNLTTALFASRPFMEGHNSASLEFFFYTICFDEE